MRNLNLDELLRGEVVVEVFFVESCHDCAEGIRRVQGICGPQGFRVKLTAVDPASSERVKDWVLESWPHIEVSGREVYEKILEELAIDAGWIRAQHSRGGVINTWR